MKKLKSLLIIIGAGLMIFSCSLDDILAPSEDVKLAFLETVELKTALPGDTVYFQLMLSTNVGAIESIWVSDKTGDFVDLRDSITFGFVADTITLDSITGKLSKPVTTVLVNYPIAVPNNADIIGQELGLTFTARSTTGSESSGSSSFLVVNFDTYDQKSVGLRMYSNGQHQWSRLLYNADTHTEFFMNRLSQEKFQENTDLVYYEDPVPDKFGYNKEYLISPDNSEIKSILWDDDVYGFGYKYPSSEIPVYNAADMKNTKLLDVTDSIVFSTAGDKELESLDFSNATNKLEITEDTVIAFMTEEGRRGLLYNTNKWSYMTVQTKYQVVPKPAL